MESTVIESPLTNFQQAALEAAEKELNDLRTEVLNKKYLVDISKKDIEILNLFMMKDAKWSFKQALGIIEAEKVLKTALKEGKLFIKKTDIEALFYFLGRVEGSGKTVDASAFETPDDYIRILKPFDNAIERIKEDLLALEKAEFVVASRREGIEPDSSLTEK